MTGAFQVQPIALARDQYLDVILDHEGRFLRVEETMPPRLNYRRLDDPERHIEAKMRAEEWAALQKEAYTDA